MTDKTDAGKIDAYLKKEADFLKDIWKLAGAETPGRGTFRRPIPKQQDSTALVITKLFQDRYGADHTKWSEEAKGAYTQAIGHLAEHGEVNPADIVTF